MKKIININKFKIISLEEWVLYLDNTPYDYEENKDTVFVSEWVTGKYEDIIKTIDYIYKSVFPNEY